MTRTLSRPARERDRSHPYLAILLEHTAFGASVHAGLARRGVGKRFCDDAQSLEFAHPMQDPRFSLVESDGWRHRYAEAYLELNRGCRRCLAALYEIGREAGYGAHAQVTDQ